MTRRVEYHEGDMLGKYGIVFVRDSDEYYISKSGNKYRQAYFLCPYCGKEFLARVQDITNGSKQCCGCVTSQLIAKGGAASGIDIVGQKFGKLTPLYYQKIRTKSGRSKRLWYCECDCGGHTWTTVDRLTSGHTTSCGCIRSEKGREIHTKDITGYVSGMLTAQYNTGKQDSSGNYYWYCTCQCGGHKEVIASNIINNQVISCGCIVSKGETRLKQLLDELNISYKTQKTFEECINPMTNAKLKFDFYLPDLNICIEYNGKQHFDESGTWAEKEGLDIIQQRDNIKNQFCVAKGIQLVRISYTEYELLDKKYLYNRLQQKGEE